ncbi:MAG: hypothetical protein EKK40_05630 [Bradyrhizobiaceae bacterium]|nr:MAG: hypothetical protein EKK40_05630 [Bradyrhizobiaceae bacterium]
MLNLLVDYAIPGCLFLLMLIVGTEMTASDLTHVFRNGRAVIAGSAGQLALLPLVALLVQAAIRPSAPVAVGILLLSLCPNGGISNYYCYLARCNVFLSAAITAVGTFVSLLTIPFWLLILPALPGSMAVLPHVPVKAVLVQLVMLMVLPMLSGALLRRAFPKTLQATARELRWLSICIVAIILTLVVATVFDELSKLAGEIAISALAFIALAMLLGWLLGYGLSQRDRPVLVIESAVRNVGVALIMGRAILTPEAFGIFGSFLSGYFIVEIAIMVAYARFQAGTIQRTQMTPPLAS